MILGVKLKYLKSLITAYNNSYRKVDLTVCTQYSHIDLCLAEETKKLNSMAQKGNPVAQYRLSILHGDNPTGNSWLEEASDNGFAPALFDFSLGQFELGSEKDKVLAYQLMEQAAKQHFAVAQYTMAFILHWGIGTNKDEDRASNWLEKSFEQGIDNVGNL